MAAIMRQRTDIGITTVTAACLILSAVAPIMSGATVVTKSSSRNDTDYAATGVGDGNERSQEVRNVSEHGDNGNTCFTAVCNDTATMILNNMDRSVDPCDNFYKYACGGYLNSKKIPDDQTYMSSYIVSGEEIEDQFRAIFEAEIEPNEPRAHKLVKKYYKSCMNESAEKARGMQPLLASLRKIGGWPMTEGASWNESNFDWTKAIYELRESGHPFYQFLAVLVTPNGADNVIRITPPMPSRFYNSGDEDFINYKLHMSDELTLDVARSLGARINTGTEGELEETFKFMFNLLMIPNSETTINNTAHTTMTLAELERNYPNIPWQEYIGKMMSPTSSISQSQIIFVEKPIYFTRLDKLMSNTSKRVLANYIAHDIVLDSIQYLGEEKRQELLGVPGMMSMPPLIERIRKCMKRVFRLPFVVESMYVRRHLSGDTEKDVVSLMDEVKGAIRKMLETTDWLDQMTKSHALRKLDAMVGYTIFADQLSDDKLDQIYENLELDEENYYDNCHKVSMFHMKEVNGALTLKENIADNGGTKGAYRAYKNWIAKNGEEPKLPGIDMTPNQLFWMSTANMWCTKYTMKVLTRGIMEGSHSPNEYRVIGMISNIPEFAIDFACPPGSKMNPTERCSVW